MKIVSLHIYHFGALQNCKLTLDSHNFQLLFGENEAGKTTLMDFIKCMLFGFPTRSQAQRRYEPKNGNRLGGKIMIEHPKLGNWSIERIEGSKVTGDVSIYSNSGEVKEESFLKTLLDGMDQSLFQGAYCFDLDGLQKLDKLTSEEIGNFLLSTAISGERDLLEIEQAFEKKQSELFKKAGKKPVINEKMEQLKMLEQSLREHREKNETYQSVKKQKENLEIKVQQTSMELDHVQIELRAMNRLFELKPVLEKYKQLQLQLKSFDNEYMTFPENGIHRYEQWQKEVSLLNGELDYLEDRLVKIEREQQAVRIDERLLEYQSEIKKLFNKLPQYELLQKQLDEIERNVSYVQDEEKGLYDSIGETWRSEELKALTLTLSSLHEHEQILNQTVNVQEKKRRLEADLEESRIKLEDLEKEERELKQLLLPEEEYDRYEQEKNNKQQKTAVPLYAALLPAFSALLLIWSGWTSENTIVMYCGLLLLLIAGGITLAIFKKEKTEPNSQYTSDQRFFKDEMNRKQLIQLTASLSHENKVYLQLAKQLDYLEVEEARLFENAEKWADRNGFKGDPDKLLLSGYMNSLLKVKELLKQKEDFLKKIKDIKVHQSLFEEESSHLAAILEVQATDTISKKVTDLYNKLQEQMKNKAEREHLGKSTKELLERKEALVKQIEQINHQVDQLWQEAGVRNEEGYYKKGKTVTSYLKLTEEKDTLQNQLIALGVQHYEIEIMAERITEKYEETVQLLESNRKKEEEWKTAHTNAREDKAKLEWEMKKLLEDGSYSEYLHRYELLKEEWNSLVKKWASYRLSQHALQVVKEHYQKTKLPAVLETSSVYFSKITEGEYQAVLFTSANELILLKADGTRYFPHELSRGTAEQVYLAIRLAVAANAGSAGFPILMDDIAVNFDEKRTRRTMALIQEVAHDRQVLFFTCHSHLSSIVPSVPLIHWPGHTMLAEK